MFANLAGAEFGKLTVLNHVGGGVWECACKCGKTCRVGSTFLKKGRTKSCGCYRKQILRTFPYKHGHARNKNQSNEYKSWCSMLSRCYKKSDVAYKRYGGSGIRVCEEWKDSFEKFLEDMGAKPTKKHQLDRIDGSKGYCKENCRWATSKQQNNNKSNNVFVTFNGATLTVAQWSEKTGIPAAKLYRRFKCGWDPSRALCTVTKNE